MQIVDMHLGRIGVSAPAGWTNRFIRHWLLTRASAVVTSSSAW